MTLPKLTSTHPWPPIAGIAPTQPPARCGIGRQLREGYGGSAAFHVKRHRKSTVSCQWDYRPENGLLSGSRTSGRERYSRAASMALVFHVKRALRSLHLMGNECGCDTSGSGRRRGCRLSICRGYFGGGQTPGWRATTLSTRLSTPSTTSPPCPMVVSTAHSRCRFGERLRPAAPVGLAGTHAVDR